MLSNDVWPDAAQNDPLIHKGAVLSDMLVVVHNVHQLIERGTRAVNQ